MFNVFGYIMESDCLVACFATPRGYFRGNWMPTEPVDGSKVTQPVLDGPCFRCPTPQVKAPTKDRQAQAGLGRRDHVPFVASLLLLQVK